MRVFRLLTRVPGFTLPVIVGLAFAIGATTTVFSIFSAMLLRSMGMRDADRVVSVWRSDEEHGQKRVELSYRDQQQWRQAHGAFRDVALASSVNLDFPLEIGGTPELVDGTTVTGNFFAVLGARPLAGRFFTDDDDKPGAPVRIVLSYPLWRTRFGGDLSLVGRQVRLGGVAATVIGIAAVDFDLPRDVALWIPVHAGWSGVDQNLEERVFRGFARLADGVSAREAGQRLHVIVRAGESALAQKTGGSRVLVTSIVDEIYGAARPAVWILLGAVLLVLLIACANAANLLLNRSVARGHELAIRTALGAGRVQLIGLMVGESAVLATTAGVLGLTLATGGVRWLARLAPADVPRVGQAEIDLPVLLFGIGVTFLTVLLFGIAPAVLSSRRDPAEALHTAGRGSAGSTGHARLRKMLIASEGALAAMLLVGAGLLVQSFSKMAAVDAGYRPERILTFRITTDKPGQPARRAMIAAVLERVRVLPGVESAAAVLLRPLGGAVGWDASYEAEGQTAGQKNPNGNYEAISPGYFHTMGIRLLAGRDFSDADIATAPGVAIVDQATAHRHWPKGDAVGKRIRLNPQAKVPWLTVVGVVSPVRSREWERAWTDIYIPYTQRAQHRSDFVVKTVGDPWKLLPAVRREVFAVDRDQPISSVTTMEALVDGALSRSRFNGVAMAALAGCALLLAAIGIYGVLAYAVTRRRTEIGIRMALGATPREIVGLTLRDGIVPVMAGAMVGLVLAGWTGRLASALLFGVSGLDAFSLLFAAVLLAVVAVAACAVPALRAASVDPASALRGE